MIGRILLMTAWMLVGLPAGATTLPLADGAGLARLADFTGLPAGAVADPNALEGLATFGAPGGLFADGAGVLTTVLDADEIEIAFATPVTALGFEGGVVDEFFDFVDGSITLTILGFDLDFATTAGAPTFFGAVSDVPFITATLRVAAFDSNATSVAFVGLTRVGVTPVPLPPAALLLAAGLGALGATTRRTRE